MKNFTNDNSYNFGLSSGFFNSLLDIEQNLNAYYIQSIADCSSRFEPDYEPIFSVHS